MDFLNMLFTTKTGRLGLAAILGAGAAYLGGQISGAEAIGAIFVALQTLFLRDGVRKSNGK